MLKVSSFRILSYLLFAANTCFALPMSNMEGSQLTQDNPIVEQNGQYHQKNQKNRKPIQKLKLSDFQGEWIGSAESVGGLSGNDKIGNVQAIVMQSTIDSKGRGILNYGRITYYQGIQGETINLVKDKLFGFKIKIIDAEKGVISIIFYSLTDPVDSQTSSTYFAVVNRNKKTREVTSIIGQRIEREPSTATNVLTIEMNRQY